MPMLRKMATMLWPVPVRSRGGQAEQVDHADVTFPVPGHSAADLAGPGVIASSRNNAISILRLTGATGLAATTRRHSRNLDRDIVCAPTC